MTAPLSHARPALCLLAMGLFSLTGCSHQHAASFPVLPASQIVTADRIPAAASLATRGTGEQSFRAPHYGRAWIYDDDRKVILYSATLQKDDRIVISPRRHSVSVNGDVHQVSGIYERNLHAIYFAALQNAPPPALNTSAAIPADARLIDGGRDRVRFTAPVNGSLYVYSRDDRRVLLQYNLEADETFTLSPAPRATTFSADHHAGASGHGTLPPSAGGYEIYFLSNGPAATSRPNAPAS